MFEWVGRQACSRGLAIIVIVLIGGFSSLLAAQDWRVQPLSANDRQHMQNQQDQIDTLARRHFGGQLNGNKDNDIAVMQRLLDEGAVSRKDVPQLQAMGVVLGQLLKSYKGLSWVVYSDRLGRSRSLQVPGFDKEFIFPVTQISRKAEVGIKVNVREIYQQLEQAVEDIRNKPPF